MKAQTVFLSDSPQDLSSICVSPSFWSPTGSSMSQSVPSLSRAGGYMFGGGGGDDDRDVDLCTANLDQVEVQ